MGVELNGSNEYYELSSISPPGMPLTIASWFRTDAGTTFQSIGGVAYSLTADEWMLLVIRSSGVVAAQYRKGSTTNGDGGTVTAGTIHHGAAVFASSTSRTAYLDGVAGTENTTSLAAPTINTISIGRIGDSSPSTYFDGMVGEFAIWDVALSASEIATLARGVRPNQIRPGNLAAYYPAINESTAGLDSTGTFDLTKSGTPTDAEHAPIVSSLPIFVRGQAAAPAGNNGFPIIDRYYRQLMAA